MTSPRNPEAPWLDLPDVAQPVELVNANVSIDDLVDLPVGSALTLARITPDGQLHTTRWRDTGRLGFYPASTIKWATVALTLELIDQHGWGLDTVIQIGDDPALSLRRLMASTIILSSNTGFCTLHELVGTRETHQAMQRWGIHDSVVRRHFKRPTYTQSRDIKVYNYGQHTQTLEARPPFDAPDPPIHTQPTSGGKGKSNWYTTDDLTRLAAATLAGPTRQTRFFNHFANWLALTNHCYVADGLAEVTASEPARPPFIVLNKPGWWPGSGSVLELGYIHDVNRQADYAFAIYHEGTLKDAHRNTTQAFASIFRAIHQNHLDF
ncbi:MAG: serine hydrolase [Phycisphaeraceae bacterium]